MVPPLLECTILINWMKYVALLIYSIGSDMEFHYSLYNLLFPLHYLKIVPSKFTHSASQSLDIHTRTRSEHSPVTLNYIKLNTHKHHT